MEASNGNDVELQPLTSSETSSDKISSIDDVVELEEVSLPQFSSH